jgi:hypothetical protein
MPQLLCSLDDASFQHGLALQLKAGCGLQLAYIWCGVTLFCWIAARDFGSLLHETEQSDAATA